MANVDTLIVKLRELFNIKKDQPGRHGVWSIGGPYHNVVIELADYTFGNADFKKLFDAMEHAGASGFFTVPQAERESQARHCFVFYF